MVKDTMTFDGRQATRLRDMERRAEVEMRRKKREWEREVEKMKYVTLRCLICLSTDSTYMSLRVHV